MTLRVAIDLTRSLHRDINGQPTGIDRVERAAAETIVAQPGCFAIVRRSGSVWSVNRAEAAAILAGTAPSSRPFPLRRLGKHLAESADVYLAVGHNLPPAEVLADMKRKGVRVAVMIHDIIPLSHPDFATVATRRRMARQWPAVARSADTLFHLTPTGQTRWMGIFGAGAARHHVLPPPVRVPTRASPPQQNDESYLAVGTVEPRKNYDLLLDLWEMLSAAGPAPMLHIVGRAGWAERATFERLARAERAGWLTWHRDIDDDQLDRLYSNVTALLFPSLAEGYGLPVMEARLAGLPVLASDLPELRDVHNDAITYLPPTDSGPWLTSLTRKDWIFSETIATRQHAQTLGTEEAEILFGREMFRLLGKSVGR